MTYTKVQFKDNDGAYNGKHYSYLTNCDLEVNVGDIVLVDARGEYTFAKVVGFSNINNTGNDISKMILDVIDEEAIKEKQRLVEKKKELLGAIEERMKQLEWRQNIERMIEATGDTVLAELLSEYILS